MADTHQIDKTRRGPRSRLLCLFVEPSPIKAFRQLWSVGVMESGCPHPRQPKEQRAMADTLK